MIIVILVICVILAIIGFVVSEHATYSLETAAMALSALGFIGTIVALVVMFALMVTNSGNKVINEKIAMYQEENTVIEAQIEAVVKQYQEYESGIFADVTKESAITLVSLYPELKSDTLVQEQINVYIANNNKIKELKEDAIEASVVRWWLYFGK